MAKIYNIGKMLGFLAASLIFFTVLFFILSYLDKLPEAAKYIHFLGIAILIWLIKIGTRK